MQIQLLSKNFRALAKLCFSLCQALTYALLTLGRSERLANNKLVSPYYGCAFAKSPKLAGLSERKL